MYIIHMPYESLNGAALSVCRLFSFVFIVATIVDVGYKNILLENGRHIPHISYAGYKNIICSSQRCSYRACLISGTGRVKMPNFREGTASRSGN